MKVIDRIAKTYEVLSGNYRYPSAVIGRTHRILARPGQADVLVFAAHPDDESLGLGTVLQRHRKQGESLAVVYTTNGRGRIGWASSREASFNANRRYQEACDALSVIGVANDKIYCLGFPDVGLYRYVSECVHDVETLIRSINPAQIYVHGLDGGHVDHDLTNVIVLTACKKLSFSNVYEWAEYNTYANAEDPCFVFPNEQGTTPITPTTDEWAVKQYMLDKYVSQRHVIDRYRHKQETVRKASIGPFRMVPPLYSEVIQRRAFTAAVQHLKQCVLRSTY